MEALLEILGKVGFDWRMALFNLVNFFVIYLILKKFLFTPLSKKMAEREQMIKSGIDHAKQAETDLKMAHLKAQELIDDAKVHANKIIEAAHEEASVQADRLQEKAKQEIERLISQAKRNMEIDQRDMRDALRKETVELVILAVEKLVGERFDDKKDQQFIQDILGSVKR